MNYSDFGVTCAEELEQDEWSLTRPTFETPNGGVLKVIGYSGRSGNSRRYLIACSICGNDEELFGDGVFSSTKADLLRGKVSCGCSRSPKWSETQSIIRVSREAFAQGQIFLGWVGTFTGCETKCRLLCHLHGEWTTMSIRSVLKDHGCPQCGAYNTRQSNLKDDAFHIDGFMTSGKFSTGTKFWRSEKEGRGGCKPYWNYSCPRCSDDEYVQAGLCNGVFESSNGDLKRGKLSCRCSPGYRWTQEQREYQVKNEMSTRLKKGMPYLSFIGWESVNGYVNPSSKFVYLCKDHGKQSISVKGFLSRGAGCARCAGDNQHRAYINMVSEEGVSVALKLGIANSPERRLLEQNMKNLFKSFPIGVWEFPTVTVCKKAEMECKKTLKTGVLSSREMKDGWTETVSVLDLEKVIAIYEKHGGKRIK